MSPRWASRFTQTPGRSRDPVLYGSIKLPDLTLRRLADQLLPTMRHHKGQLLINDLKSDKNFGWLAKQARQLLAVPLQRQEQVLGCMFLLDKHSSEFDSVDAKLFNSIANESAIYLENSQLFGDVHGLMMGLLHSLTSAVDAKDSYTCGHSERVALLSRHLATEIGLPDAEVEQIYMAGLLHDVGKIGVPESVLQKTGRLTNEEFDQMKKHPKIGARILADVKQVKALDPRRAPSPRAIRWPRLSLRPGRHCHSADGPYHLSGRLLRCDDFQPHVSQSAAVGSCPDRNPPLRRHPVRSHSGRGLPPQRPRLPARTPPQPRREIPQAARPPGNPPHRIKVRPADKHFLCPQSARAPQRRMAPHIISTKLPGCIAVAISIPAAGRAARRSDSHVFKVMRRTRHSIAARSKSQCLAISNSINCHMRTHVPNYMLRDTHRLRYPDTTGSDKEPKREPHRLSRTVWQRQSL